MKNMIAYVVMVAAILVCGFTMWYYTIKMLPPLKVQIVD